MFYNTLATNLSGGNKRKLSTLQAMIGNPAIILLDESSAGVDPYSRRRLWKTIRDESSQSALIVTTHSMEEAEALGTKMAIQVQGEFKCFGTAQEIKAKFGKGFSMLVKFDLEQIMSENQELLMKASELGSG
jgi:ATP-binding cassette subfamily A (ABC1) protein 3